MAITSILDLQLKPDSLETAPPKLTLFTIAKGVYAPSGTSPERSGPLRGQSG